jgi:hypothetical protein
MVRLIAVFEALHEYIRGEVTEELSKNVAPESIVTAQRIAYMEGGKGVGISALGMWDRIQIMMK